MLQVTVRRKNFSLILRLGSATIRAEKNVHAELIEGRTPKKFIRKSDKYPNFIHVPISSLNRIIVRGLEFIL